MTGPTPKHVKAITEIGGIVVTDSVAERIAAVVGPMYDSFAAISGKLSMDIEPATFLLVQNKKATK